MSHRARIAVRTDGGYRSCYVHHGGAIGSILAAHYATQAKANALVNLGHLSQVGPKLGRKHDFDRHLQEHPDWCLAYHRDRGDEEFESGPEDHGDFEDLKQACVDCDAEVLYLFGAKEVWIAGDIELVPEFRNRRTCVATEKQK